MNNNGWGAFQNKKKEIEILKKQVVLQDENKWGEKITLNKNNEFTLVKNKTNPFRFPNKIKTEELVVDETTMKYQSKLKSYCEQNKILELEYNKKLEELKKDYEDKINNNNTKIDKLTNLLILLKDVNEDEKINDTENTIITKDTPILLHIDELNNDTIDTHELITEPTENSIIICINDNTSYLYYDAMCQNCRIVEDYNRIEYCDYCKFNNTKNPLPSIKRTDVVKINNKIFKMNDTTDYFVYITINNILITFSKEIIYIKIDNKQQGLYWKGNSYGFDNLGIVKKIYKDSIIKYEDKIIELIDNKTYYEFAINGYIIKYDKKPPKNIGDCFNRDTIFRYSDKDCRFIKEKYCIYVKSDNMLYGFDFENSTIDKTISNKNLNLFFRSTLFFKGRGEFFCKIDNCFKCATAILEGSIMDFD